VSENPVLSELQWDAESGSLLYRGIRYLLIRPETIAGALNAGEAEIPGAIGRWLSAGGAEGGAKSGERFRRDHHLSHEEALRFMCEMGAQIGWGRFVLTGFVGAPPSFAVEVFDSPFAEHVNQPAPACHLIRGVLGGLGRTLFASSGDCVEVACAAGGAESCRFEWSGA
jgi:predicted hydrocarbon binding protein